MSSSWWVDQIGATAGATYNRQTGQPAYGAALDIGMSPLPGVDRETMLADVRTAQDDEEAEAPTGPWGSGTMGNVGRFLGSIGRFFARAWDGITENEYSPLRYPAKGVEALASKGVYATQRAWDNSGADSALDGIVDAIVWGGRAVSTYQTAQNIATAEGDYTFMGRPSADWDVLFDPETWSKAWEMTDPDGPSGGTSVGRASIDAILMAGTLGSEGTQDIITRGYVNPNDPSFAEYRQTSTPYNIVTGVTDFASAWYLAPEVLALKGIGAGTRTLAGRTTLMSQTQRARFTTIATASEDELAEIGVRRASLLDKSALRARQRISDLRNGIRSGEIRYEQLADMPFARHAAQGDAGAAAFVIERAAKSADEETWRTVVRASMGDESARDALRLHADTEIADAINAMHADRIELDTLVQRNYGATERLQKALKASRQNGDPEHVTYLQERLLAKQSELAGNRTRLDEMYRNEQEYEQLQTALMKAAGEVWESSAPAGREGLLIDAPKAPHIDGRGLIRRTYAYKPTEYGPMRRIMATSSMAWRRQPGVVDLHRGDGVVENARAYLDQVERYAHGALDETWGLAREDILRRLGGATTDVERRALMQQMQDVAIDRMARNYGLDVQDATTLRRWLERKQKDALASMLDEDSHIWTRASIDLGDGKTQRLDLIDRGDGLQTLPISTTQLQNYFTAVDLRQLNKMFAIHGDDIKGTLASARAAARDLGDVVENALDKYNHLWKFSVLFRLGYPVRTVADDSMRALAAMGGFQFMLEQVHAPQIARRARRGVKNTRSTVAGDGQRYLVAEALSGRSGSVYRRLASSDAAWGQFFDVYLDKFHKARRQRLVPFNPGDKDYAAQWARLLDDQILKDPVVGRLLDDAPDDEIIRWLKDTPEGKDILERLPGYVDGTVGDSVEDVLFRLKEHLDYMAPGEVRDILKRARHGDLADDRKLKKFTEVLEEFAGRAEPDLLPTVDMATSGMVTGLEPLAAAYTAITSRVFKYLQQIPNDTLVRNPFFRANYNRRVNEILSQYGPGRVTPQVLARAQRDANEYALTRLRRYLFSLNEETELLHVLRHFIPFGTAHVEAMRKWGQVFLDNPVGVYRVWGQGWAGLGDLAFIEEVDPQTGDKIEAGDRWTNDSVLRFRVPETMIDTLPFLQAFYNKDGEVWGEVSKSATNLIVQGDPFYIPSVGPVVQIPADWFFKRNPHLAAEGAPTKGFYDWLFPIGGPRESWHAALPTAAMKAMQASTDDPAFNATEALIAKQVEANFRQANGRAPNRREYAAMMRHVEQQATWVRRFYFLGSLTLPANVRFLPGDQEFIEQYRRYQREYGPDGYARFVEDFGWEIAVIGQSMSVSNNGVPSTGIGNLDYNKMRSLIQDYPELGDILVSPEAFTDEYSQAFYRYQQQQPVGPGRPERQRTQASPAQALEDAQVRQGWEEYGKVRTWVREQLTARFGEGATLSQKGAEDLAAIQRESRALIAEKFPSWAAAYGERDTRWGFTYLTAARSMLADLEERDPNYATYLPHLAGLRDYIELHDWVAGELEARRSAGGSGTLFPVGAEHNAASAVEGNEDLAAIWEAGVALITHRNPAFADQVYDRKLDNWAPGVLTP